jgi:hypothetical protein
MVLFQPNTHYCHDEISHLISIFFLFLLLPCSHLHEDDVQSRTRPVPGGTKIGQDFQHCTAVRCTPTNSPPIFLFFAPFSSQPDGPSPQLRDQLAYTSCCTLRAILSLHLL